MQTQHTVPLNVHYPDHIVVVLSKMSSTMPLYWHVGIKIHLRYLSYFPCNPHRSNLDIDVIELVVLPGDTSEHFITAQVSFTALGS